MRATLRTRRNRRGALRLLLVATGGLACGPGGSTAETSATEEVTGDGTEPCETVDSLLIRTVADAEAAANVCAVESTFAVVGLDESVTSLPPLARLVQAGSITIGNTSLTNLDFLAEVRVVDGTVGLSDNPALTDLSGLGALERAGRYVQSGTPGIPVGGPLALTGTPTSTLALYDLEGPLTPSDWRSFEFAEGTQGWVNLGFGQASSLEGLQGALPRMDVLVLESLELPSLAGLGYLAELESLMLLDVRGLSDIGVLTQVAVRNLQMVETPAVLSLAPVDTSRLERLRLGGCAARDYGALPNYAAAGYRVEQLQGAASLTSVEMLDLPGPSTINLDGFPALEIVNLINNPNLPQADASAATTGLADGVACGNGGEPLCTKTCEVWGAPDSG